MYIYRKKQYIQGLLLSAVSGIYWDLRTYLLQIREGYCAYILVHHLLLRAELSYSMVLTPNPLLSQAARWDLKLTSALHTKSCPREEPAVTGQ